MRTFRSGLVAVGLLALGVGTTGPASAAPPAGPESTAITLSAASGAPGTVIDVGTSCTPTDRYDRYLSVQLFSGTGAQEQLAGFGSVTGPTAKVVVPDWVDPALPAHIEATCFSFENDSGEEVDTTKLDQAAFDITPGAGPSVQIATFSRTTLSTGQGFTVSSDGCTLAGAQFARVILVSGTDVRAERNLYGIGFGGDEVDGTSFSVDTLLRAQGYGFSSIRRTGHGR